MGAAKDFVAQLMGTASDECIPWPFARNKEGYGRFKHRGKLMNASRAVCEIAHGVAPGPEYQAAHSCGNGMSGCVNPRHLSWKTRSQNQWDKLAHGTGGKLTPSLAVAISRDPLGCNRAARKYGVSNTTVKQIRRGEIWKEAFL